MAPARLQDSIVGEKYTHNQTVSVFEKRCGTGPAAESVPRVLQAAVGLGSGKITVNHKRRFADHALGVDWASQKPFVASFRIADRRTVVKAARPLQQQLSGPD